jgi:spore germination protein KC
MIQKFSLLLLCIFCLSGCWDKKELDEIGTVIAVALDKDPKTGDIDFTSQIIRPEALEPEGGGAGSPVEIISTTGRTVFESIRNGLQVSDRRFFYAHTKVIVINEALAKEEILPVLDTFSRQQEMPRYVWLAVTKDIPAKEILGVKSKIESIQAQYLKNIIENEKFHSKASTPHLVSYYINSLEQGIEPTIGVLEIEKHKEFPAEIDDNKIIDQVKFSGVAVVKEDKVVGYLNEQETQGLNWLLQEVDSRVLLLPALIEENKLITLEIVGSATKIIPEINGENLSFVIDVQTEVALAEQQAIDDLTELGEIVDYLEKIEEKSSQLIKEEITTVVSKVQQEYKSDIFGFGQALEKKHPKKWNEIKEQWGDIFPTVNYEVKVDTKMVKTNFKQGTFKRKD